MPHTVKCSVMLHVHLNVQLKKKHFQAVTSVIVVLHYIHWNSQYSGWTLNQHLSWHSFDPSLHLNLSWQWVENQLIFNQFIWISRHWANYQPTLDHKSIECQPSNNSDVNRGCQSSVSIGNPMQMPLVYMIQRFFFRVPKLWVRGMGYLGHSNHFSEMMVSNTGIPSTVDQYTTGARLICSQLLIAMLRLRCQLSVEWHSD